MSQSCIFVGALRWPYALGRSSAAVENAIGSGIASAQQAKLIAAQVDQAKSAAELNEASAMKGAEAWQTANYAGPG